MGSPLPTRYPKRLGCRAFFDSYDFAPTIFYKGVEDIRFTPGWGKKETNDYWSYAFLWYLDSFPKFDSRTIEKNLIAYYTGLFNVNTDKTKFDSTRLKPVTATVKKRTLRKGDLKTFEGTVDMLDFLTQKPIVINLVIHIISCEGQNKTFVFYEVSPKPYSDPVWIGLDQLWNNFKCTKE